MRRLLFLALALSAAALHAQPPVAPTNEPVGSARGSDFGGYNLTQAWEVGYRFHTVTGSEGTYRADVNYGNGIRLLSGKLAMYSKDGKGKWFDELLFNAIGLGNDPYQYTSVRVAKNRLYRYDFIWRSNAYFNPALPIAYGFHALDTVRDLSDNNFVLFPTRRIQVFAGYSRNSVNGPGLTTELPFDIFNSAFPLFTNISRKQTEWRIGNQFDILGLRWNWMYVYESFEDQSPVYSKVPLTIDATTLTSLNRRQPYTGNTPSIRASVFRDKSGIFAVNGRFTYSSGRRDFLFDETAIGSTRFGFARNRQIVVGGNGSRPVGTGYLTITLFPTDRLSITNHTAYYNTRLEGQGQYRDVDNSELIENRVDFQYLGIRTFTNVTDVIFRWTPRLSLHGGYQYSNRGIRSVEQAYFKDFDFTDRLESSQTNHLNAGTAGVRYQFTKSLFLLLDGEIGRQNRPFYPISRKDNFGYSARLQYRKGPFVIQGMGSSGANFNSVSLTSFSARSSQVAVNGSWTPRDWFSVDAAYAWIDTKTAAGINYFAPRFVAGQNSLFFSSLHSLTLGTRLGWRRFDFYLGYNLNRDTGDGRSNLAIPADPSSTAEPAFLREVQVFPMTFQSPLARVSVRLTEKIRWNAGYMYYSYSEVQLPVQNYHANTGYVSLLWTF